MLFVPTVSSWQNKRVAVPSISMQRTTAPHFIVHSLALASYPSSTTSIRKSGCLTARGPAAQQGQKGLCEQLRHGHPWQFIFVPQRLQNPSSLPLCSGCTLLVSPCPIPLPHRDFATRTEIHCEAERARSFWRQCLQTRIILRAARAWHRVQTKIRLFLRPLPDSSSHEHGSRTRGQAHGR